ncbi:unnamed protein product [Meganyctiphanes norvegica]|uniref:Uncharacterized protein n=1 Tax=Meganyctiphanes norvegica TaxID=48144 RepID=A0AAV2REV8_MEGNR
MTKPSNKSDEKREMLMIKREVNNCLSSTKVIKTCMKDHIKLMEEHQQIIKSVIRYILVGNFIGIGITLLSRSVSLSTFCVPAFILSSGITIGVYYKNADLKVKIERDLKRVQDLCNTIRRVIPQTKLEEAMIISNERGISLVQAYGSVHQGAPPAASNLEKSVLSKSTNTADDVEGMAKSLPGNIFAEMLNGLKYKGIDEANEVVKNLERGLVQLEIYKEDIETIISKYL